MVNLRCVFCNQLFTAYLEGSKYSIDGILGTFYVVRCPICNKKMFVSGDRMQVLDFEQYESSSKLKELSKL